MDGSYYEWILERGAWGGGARVKKGDWEMWLNGRIVVWMKGDWEMWFRTKPESGIGLCNDFVFVVYIKEGGGGAYLYIHLITMRSDLSHSAYTHLIYIYMYVCVCVCVFRVTRSAGGSLKSVPWTIVRSLLFPKLRWAQHHSHVYLLALTILCLTMSLLPLWGRLVLLTSLLCLYGKLGRSLCLQALIPYSCDISRRTGMHVCR